MRYVRAEAKARRTAFVRLIHAMISNDNQTSQMDELLATPDLADALESEQFKRFLDQIPIAIIVSELKGTERIVYVNPEFEKLCRQTAAEVSGKPWSILDKHGDEEDLGRGLGAAVVETSDYVGVFRIECPGRNWRWLMLIQILFKTTKACRCFGSSLSST